MIPRLAAALALGLLALPGLAGAAGPLAQVIVTPSVASMPYASTLQLTAEGRDANGQPVPLPTVEWRADVGTIDATGRYTPTRVGLAHVTATADGIAGAATLYVEGHPALAVAMATPHATAGLATATGLKGEVQLRYVEDGTPIAGVLVSVFLQRGRDLPMVSSFENLRGTTGSAGTFTFTAPASYTLPDHYTVVAAAEMGRIRHEARTSYDVDPHP